MIGGGDVTEDEMVVNALDAVQVSKLIESEGTIESLIKAQGFQDCIAYLDGENAKVVVKTEGLEKLCMGDTNNILIELPTGPWTDWVYEALSDIIFKRRLHPIAAHIDRYIEEHDINKLLEMGIPFQVNASFYKNRKIRRRIMALIDSGSAMYIGSDVHTSIGGHYRQFEKTAKKLRYYMDDITEQSRIAIGTKKPQSPFSARRMD